MSALKKDRWQSMSFTREIGRYSLAVELDRGPRGSGRSKWSWCVLRGIVLEAQGDAKDEKTAKLEARRATERCLVRDAREGFR